MTLNKSFELFSCFMRCMDKIVPQHFADMTNPLNPLPWEQDQVQLTKFSRIVGPKLNGWILCNSLLSNLGAKKLNKNETSKVAFHPPPKIRETLVEHVEWIAPGKLKVT